MRHALAMLALCASCARALSVTLIRHGETEWNRAGRLQGASDSPLTGVGVKQCIACGQRLKDSRFDLAISSPLPRAVRTAELVLEQMSAPPPLQHDPRLAERSFGDWEGLSWSEIEQKFPNQLRSADANPRYAMPGGESRQQVLDRALAFFGELSKRKCESVLIVTHSATATLMIKKVLGLRLEQRRTFFISNLAVNVLEFDRRRNIWLLRTLGDCTHLQDLSEDPPET